RFWQARAWGRSEDGVQVVVYPRRRSGAGGFDIVLYAADQKVATTARLASSVLGELAAAGALHVPNRAIDAARVAAGVSTAGGEGGEGVLPQEAGLTSALSYRKGCYLGQEVMARIEARGNLKRGLVTVEVRGDGAATWVARTPEERVIELDGRSVGRLGTTAVMPDGRVVALAVMRRDLDEG